MTDGSNIRRSIVDYFENQRRYPFVGWSEKKMLPSDRWKFSSRDGKEERRREALQPPYGYQWADGSDWHVEEQETLTGADGWAYAFDFPFTYHPKEGRHDWVRRRRWIREVVSTEETRRAREGGEEEATAEKTEEGRKEDDEAKKKQWEEEENVKYKLQVKKEREADFARDKLVNDVLLCWCGHHSNRCGGLQLTVDRLMIPNADAVLVSVIAGKKTEDSKKPIATMGAATNDEQGQKEGLLGTDDYFQCMLNIVDDQDPIRIVVSHATTHQIAGEAVLPLRRASVISGKLVSENGTYNELANNVILKLHPPANGDGPLRRSDIGSLGSIAVSWHFELQDTTGISRHLQAAIRKDRGGDDDDQGGSLHHMVAFCDICGKSVSRCKCVNNSNNNPSLPEGDGASSPTSTTITIKAPSRKLGRVVFNVLQIAGLSSDANAYVRLCGRTSANNIVFAETAAVKSEKNDRFDQHDVTFDQTLVLDVGDIFHPLTASDLAEAVADCKKRGHNGGALTHCFPCMISQYPLYVEIWERHTFGSDKFLGCCGLRCPNEAFREAVDSLLLEQQQLQHHDDCASPLAELAAESNGIAAPALLAYPQMMMSVPVCSRGDGVEDDRALLAQEKTANAGGALGYLIFNAMWIPYTL